VPFEPDRLDWQRCSKEPGGFWLSFAYCRDQSGPYDGAFGHFAHIIQLVFAASNVEKKQSIMAFRAAFKNRINQKRRYATRIVL
jgi:hypothetical protein